MWHVWGRGHVHNRHCCEKLKEIFHFEEDVEIERETILKW